MNVSTAESSCSEVSVFDSHDVVVPETDEEDAVDNMNTPTSSLQSAVSREGELKVKKKFRRIISMYNEESDNDETDGSQQCEKEPDNHDDPDVLGVECNEESNTSHVDSSRSEVGDKEPNTLDDTESDNDGTEGSQQCEKLADNRDDPDVLGVECNEESNTSHVDSSRSEVGDKEPNTLDNTVCSVVDSVSEHTSPTEGNTSTKMSEVNEGNNVKKGSVHIESEESCYIVSSDEDTNKSEISESKNSKQRNITTEAPKNVRDTNDVERISIENRLEILDLTDESFSLPKRSPTNDKVYNPPKEEIATNEACAVPKQDGATRQKLKSEIDILTKDVFKLQKTLMSVDISRLPDRGVKLQLKLQESKDELMRKKKMIAGMPEVGEEVGTQVSDVNVHRLPKGFGVKALQTEIREKTLTEEALQRLHGSINTCPSEDALSDDPKGLKRGVVLMPHQKHALVWLTWRENQKPRGGVLADDMGLGKTLTMISLVLKDKQERGEEEDSSTEDDSEKEEEEGGWFSTRSSELPKGGTLVVCPASLLMQWADEIKKHCRSSVLEVEVFHGSNRETSARHLAKNDIVITTYSIVRTSCNNVKDKKGGVLHRINWNRIILDEAHVVRNHKSQQSIAVCKLKGRRRWALSGTPIHNKELDLYALLKFLKCSPFDDYNVWRRWVDNKNAAGLKRLNTVIDSIMLRRTKESLTAKGQMSSLPAKTMTEVEVHLDKEEYSVYTKILVFSKTLFAQFLHQRAEKEHIFNANPLFAKPAHLRDFNREENPFQCNPELSRMYNKMHQLTDIKTHQILVLLLRLRQICCHPGLIKSMIEEGDKKADGIEDNEGTDLDLLSQLSALSLGDTDSQHEGDGNGDEEPNVLTHNNPVFKFERPSAKMRAVFEVMDEKVLGTSDKCVVVSQWTSMLNIVRDHLVKKGVKSRILSGEVPVKDRMDIVRDFNEKSHGFQVLLLSLAAGGVGLNLIGGNHLFLIDLHWNPQLENQAFDRVYRFGQTKPVYVYKFICQETIEQNIRALQEKKLTLAADVLSGTMRKSSNKLTLEDLKSLFSM